MHHALSHPNARVPFDSTYTLLSLQKHQMEGHSEDCRQAAEQMSSMGWLQHSGMSISLFLFTHLPTPTYTLSKLVGGLCHPLTLTVIPLPIPNKHKGSLAPSSDVHG
jgi:hypothetical protein